MTIQCSEKMKHVASSMVVGGNCLKYIHIYVHTYIRTYIHTRTHTYTHIHTHTHTSSPGRFIAI